MTDREAQIEALWTYEISKEKVLTRLVKKEIMTQAEADDLSERMLEQLGTGKIPGFRLSPLDEKMHTNGSCLNLYVSCQRKPPTQATSSKAGCRVILRLNTCECGRKSTTLNSKRMPVMN